MTSKILLSNIAKSWPIAWPSGNWKNEKLCGNTTPEGRSVFTQFRVFPIFTSVDITIYQHGS